MYKQNKFWSLTNFQFIQQVLFAAQFVFPEQEGKKAKKSWLDLSESFDILRNEKQKKSFVGFQKKNWELGVKYYDGLAR